MTAKEPAELVRDGIEISFVRGEPDQDVNWGAENTWMGTDKRFTGDGELHPQFGATTMGLIYLNPEGPEGKPDPAASARAIRVTFGWTVLWRRARSTLWRLRTSRELVLLLNT